MSRLDERHISKISSAAERCPSDASTDPRFVVNVFSMRRSPIARASERARS
jgi:hypothetical protein